MVGERCGPCGYLCPELTLAPWAASVTKDEDTLTSGEFFAFDGIYIQDVVWPRLDRAAPLPYDYLLLSMSVYRMPGLPENGPPPDWPESAQSVVILMQLSDDGRVDLATQDVLYKRFVHLHRVSRFPFWPRIKTNTSTPEVADVIAQLIGPVSSP